MNVLEFKHSGLDPVKVLEGALEEAKQGNTRNCFIVSIDHKGIPCIFATNMNRMEYAVVALAAQDLALHALRGQIEEVHSDPEPDPEPPGGPAS